ncbi:unnamed protein product [Cylicocyclus nassatus]|uniref:Uncharacterized protein n=1 Tax=Cylicocyclus nassatus TaxID=53992 RepID=A0AA36H061_CYLNA|nr:unnamed protein product [Cylicocyclus nassatus]
MMEEGQEVQLCMLVRLDNRLEMAITISKADIPYVYCEPLLDSAMLSNTVFHAQDKVIKSNLGEITGGQRVLQCTLPNLEELVWHNVDMDLLLKSNFPKYLLSITAEAQSMYGFQLLSEAHINTMFSRSQYDGYQVEPIQFFREIISIEIFVFC